MQKFLLAIIVGLAAGASWVAQGQTSATPTAPCPYQYPAGHRPACVGGHTNGLLPIVYGRPTPQTRQRARQGKVVLRGCLVSACDPRYYCPLHKKDL